MRLKYRLALPTTIVISLLLAVSVIADSVLQKYQNENSLHEQAYILSEEMQAAWDFITVNQDRINTDSEGDYDFKGLHCSIAGTSIGALFTSRTDYVIRYVSDNPRNERNTADDLESKAIAAFRSDPSLAEYSDFESVENGMEYYRYLVPLQMEPECASCHGQPAGEIDESGFPKEGLTDGDLVGVASISIPTDTYQANLNAQIALRALLSTIVLASCLLTIYFVAMKHVIKPLGKVSDVVRKVGTGSLESRINLDDMKSEGEIRTLSIRFNEMADELDSLHKDLERKVDERTEQLAEANDILAEQARALEAANARLQADERYKSHYFTMMSHELRTPLTAIHAYISMLKDPSIDESTRQNAVQAIQANTVSLSKLVNDILDSARIEAGAVKLEKQVVDAADMANHLAKTLEPLALSKSIELVCRFDDLPFFIADENKLLHILENLGANAIKYSKEGQDVSITARTCPQDRAICFDVVDHGIGISEDDQRIVFRKFTQAENAVARPVSGSGLGLSLAMEYAELHGGKISVQSSLGKGSTFTVCIPYEKPDFDLE